MWHRSDGIENTDSLKHGAAVSVSYGRRYIQRQCECGSVLAVLGLKRCGGGGIRASHMHKVAGMTSPPPLGRSCACFRCFAAGMAWPAIWVHATAASRAAPMSCQSTAACGRMGACCSVSRPPCGRGASAGLTAHSGMACTAYCMLRAPEGGLARRHSGSRGAPLLVWPWGATLRAPGPAPAPGPPRCPPRPQCRC